MRKLVVLTIATIALSGCTAILLKLNGIKNPDIENHRSLIRYASKTGLDTSDLVTVNADDYLKQLRVTSIPDVAFFDRNGAYIEYRATDTSCNAGVFAFIPALKETGDYRKTGKTTLQEEQKKWRTLDGMPLNTLWDGSSAFYMLIYWVAWEGRLNKNHVREWEQLAKANHTSKIRVIKVNLDLQQYWDAVKRDSIIQRLSPKNK